MTAPHDNKARNELKDFVVLMLTPNSGGITVNEAINRLDAYVDSRVKDEQLEGKQQEWNTIWAEWLKGDDDEFDEFMREENARLWPVTDNQEREK